MKNKWSFTVILIVILSILSIFLFGFKLIRNLDPIELYAIYLDGNKIGTVKSKEDFNDYINKQEETLKDIYKVDKIYTPKGVDIKKVITYNNVYDSNEAIYNMLVNKENFTIKGIIVEIDKKNEEGDEPSAGNLNNTSSGDSNQVDDKVIINVLNKDIFDEAINDLVKAFVNEEEYKAFLEAKQEPIVDTGEIIESVYILDDIKYYEGYISTNEKIFTDKGELSKFLLYGSTKEQDTYTVKEGDTIESVANFHKLNTQEFLIANPEFTSVNNLLYESQQVVVGLINPIINIVVEKHSVKDEVSNFTTEIKYDSDMVIGYSYVEREGEDGQDRVTRKYQYINGRLADVALIGSTQIKPPVSKILVKGDRYVPNVADLSYWAWPTQTPYSITTGYEYRWGSFHAAIDIVVGFGSSIYAANNGTVVEANSGCIRGDTKCNGGRGNYIIINHNIGGYYTQYMHLNSVLVTKGQTVERGQRIATMGNTGSVVPTPAYGSSSYSGTHLDFGVWIGMPYQGGYTLNPFSLY